MIEIEAPDEFVCPISLEVMSDPVMSRYGNSFERSAILQWLNQGHGVCPLSRRPLGLQDLVSNHALRMRISKWEKDNGQECKVVVKPKRDQQVYGFITLPSKDGSSDDEGTDRTVDEDEDIIFVDMDRLRRQQQRIRELYGVRDSHNNNRRRNHRRHRRRNSTGSATATRSNQNHSNNGNRRTSLRGSLQGLRNLFSKAAISS